MSKKDYITVVDGLVSAYGIMLESADFGHREVLADTVREVAAVLACRFGAENPRFNAGYFHARLDQGLEAEVEEFLAKSSGGYDEVDSGSGFTFGALSLGELNEALNAPGPNRAARRAASRAARPRLAVK